MFRCRVLLQPRTMPELAFTIPTVVRAPSVRFHVRHQVALHVKPMPANRALVLLPAGVNQLVILEVRRLGERLSAYCANVALLVLVLYPDVDVEAGFLREEKVAFGAMMRPDPGVGVGVCFQVLHPAEAFTTLGAQEFSGMVFRGRFQVLVDGLDVPEHSLFGNEP